MPSRRNHHKGVSRPSPSPSSSRPSSSRRPSITLDSLIPELIDKILELAVPKPALSNRNREEVEQQRRKALLAYCLVCRRISERARPLLWRILDVNEG